MSEGHTHDQECPLCPGEHGRPSRCDHARYSSRLLRFVQAHRDVYEAAYIDGHAESARNQLERLDREYRTLPPRHDCTCNPYHCAECKRLDDQRPKGKDVAIEIGRTSLVNAPTPDPTLLDVARARGMGKHMTSAQIARWLNGE